MDDKQKLKLESSREKFSEAYETLNKAFIRFSLAHADLNAQLKELTDDLQLSINISDKDPK